MNRSTGKVIKLSRTKNDSRSQPLLELYREHGHAVVNFVRRRTLGIGEDPEDIAQEVFAKISARDQFWIGEDKDKHNIRAYLFSMANNLIVDLQRRQQVQFRYLQSEKDNSTPEDEWNQDSPEDLVMLDSYLKVYKQVLADLKPSWRQVFLLRRFKYMSYRQIAEHLGLTEKKAEHYFRHAIVRLKAARDKLDRAGEAK
ncbi:RNA polymerase sigma factor [Porticoccaceae bacterium LTM1]|nr:RNA polymerase sigma factor [Porticoccaceae bacterium LTM1]